MSDHDRALEANPIELLFRSIENLRKYRLQGGRGDQVAYAAHVDAVRMNARDALAAVMEAAKREGVKEYLDSLLEGLPEEAVEAARGAMVPYFGGDAMDTALRESLHAFLRSLRTGLEGEGDEC